MSKFLFSFLLGAILLAAPTSYSAQMQCHGKAQHWRDIAYSTGVMSKYKDVRNCIAWTAYQFDLPEELLYAMLDVERGPVNGKCRNNKNGTQDCGPAQINDVRLSELKEFNLSDDIEALYYVTDYGQLIVAAYSLEAIQSAEMRIAKSPVAAVVLPTAKYNFAQSILYEFAVSGYTDFGEFLESLDG